MSPRQDAFNKGLTRYFTGIPCPQGHIAERMVSTRACCECAREKKHRWNKENPEKVAAQKREYTAQNIEKVKAWKSESQKRNRESANRRNRKYAEANREKLRDKDRRYREENRERERARVLEWRANNLIRCAENGKRWRNENPDKVAAYTAAYRASKLKATPQWADFDKINRAYELCAEYRAKGIDCEVDHIIPLQGENVSGLHVQGNLQIISMKHNRSKSNDFRSNL